MNLRTGMYHLASGAEGRARCGWHFAESGVRGSEPPPWYFITCKQCAPALRRRLKAEARGEAARVSREHPEPAE